MDVFMVDSFIKGVTDALDSSVYNEQKKTKNTLFSTVSSSTCQACYTGVRSVKECMATLFCPRPEVKLDFAYYQVLTATNNGLAVPLLSRHPQDNQDQYADIDLFSDSDSFIDENPLPSLEPLGSVTYESLSDEGLSQFLHCDGGST